MHIWRVAACICMAIALGCASTGDKRDVSVAPTTEQLEADLKAKIDDELAREHAAQDAGKGDVVFKRPYYFKQYYEFPNAVDVYSLDFTEKESRTTPMTAELEVEKVRYATRPKQDKDDVQSDQNYLRSHGINYVSYELRNGEWRRVGELFLADKTEEQVNGEWQPVKEEKRPKALVAEENKSWFDKLKFWK